MINTRSIALAAGSSVALFAGSLAVAPVAKADCAPWELQACWGAIAYSPKTGAWGSDTNAKSQSHAQTDALVQCGIAGPTNDCVTAIWGPACLALATNSAVAYNGAAGPTLDAADAAALADVPDGGGQITAQVCNS
jgi:hypothetical protein